MNANKLNILKIRTRIKKVSLIGSKNGVKWCQ